MEEIWKPVAIIHHEVSNLGNVRHVDTKRPLSLRKDKDGYLKASFTVGVHRLVVQAFLESCGKPLVNHKDGNKANNHLYNLEWATHSENTKHAFRTGLMNMDHLRGIKSPNAKLSEKQVREIRKKYKTGRYTHRQLAKEYGLGRGPIGRLILRKSWASLKD